MKITDKNLIYEIPEIIANLLRNAILQAESINQEIDIRAFIDSLPNELKMKIKVYEKTKSN